jgi:hypothetical protein
MPRLTVSNKQIANSLVSGLPSSAYLTNPFFPDLLKQPELLIVPTLGRMVVVFIGDPQNPGGRNTRAERGSGDSNRHQDESIGHRGDNRRPAQKLGRFTSIKSSTHANAERQPSGHTTQAKFSTNTLSVGVSRRSLSRPWPLLSGWPCPPTRCSRSLPGSPRTWHQRSSPPENPRRMARNSCQPPDGSDRYRCQRFDRAPRGDLATGRSPRHRPRCRQQEDLGAVRLFEG